MLITEVVVGFVVSSSVVDGMQWQPQQPQSHETMSVATTVWNTPGPGSAQQMPPGQQSMMPQVGGPGQAGPVPGGVGGYPQQMQRQMGPAGAGMGQYQRGPNGMGAGAMFVDGSGTSGVAAMSKYNAYGVRQPGPTGNVPFSQHK
jgi:hypothetical protein